MTESAADAGWGEPSGWGRSFPRVARVGGEGRELFVLRECIRRMNRPTGPTPAQRGRRPGNQRPG
ncbi:hypothetical protein [Micromonospora sp. NBC_01412]|uniref:hypothetical protein n=1 Tax=Micromonospora sp. NBC_01412 TaxID=2903590 RepID=UPI00324C55DD